MKTYGVIMAGGGGTRFWPMSRKAVPKQLLNLSGKDLMVNDTIDRFEGIVEKEDIYIVTNVVQADTMRTATTGRLPESNILAEPAARNTAACIGYAAMEIIKKRGDGIMCILASDHYIKNTEGFQTVLKDAVKTAQTTDALVTLGIAPTFPSTGYGYIRSGEEVCGTNAYMVEDFVEKPDLETAEAYLEAGNYLWNSGMFIWKASTILGYFERLLPDIYACLTEIGDSMGTPAEQETINRVYPVIPKISIDYGIMERADHVLVLKGDFGWNDIGSFDALTAIYEPDAKGNIGTGKRVMVDTENSIICANKRLIATVGVQDLIVVETGDAVLVCHKSKAQDVKKIVETLEQQGETGYL